MIFSQLNSLWAWVGGGGTRALAARAAIWTFLGFGMQNALRLASNLILTRILAPEMFGLMALANVFILGLTLISDVGTTASVVRSDRGEDKSFLQTVWTVQVIRGFLVAGCACALALPLSRVYDEPLLLPILAFMSLSSVFKGFQSVSLAVQSRKMDIFWVTAVNLGGQLTAVVLTVVLAFLLTSVWALAIGAVAGAYFVTLFSHLLLPRFHHRLHLEPDALREIIRFGRWILVGTVCGYLGGQGVQAVQGALVPIDILGKIAIAAMIGYLPGQLVQKILAAVAFPSFSKLRRERPEALPKALLQARVLILCVTYPMFFGLALLAEPIIDILYDPRYLAAWYFLALILAEEAISTLSAPYQNLMLSEGNSRFHAFVMSFWALARVSGIFIGFQIAGVAGMFAGMAVGSTLMFFFSASLAWRRGYASKLLDIAAVAIGIGFYTYLFLNTDMPAVLEALG